MMNYLRLIVSLMKPLAIPLGCQKTTTRCLVITPVPPFDGTASHSTRLQSNRSQVAGYPANARGMQAVAARGFINA